MEELLSQSTGWQAEQTIRVTLGGLNPRIFVLRRQDPKGSSIKPISS